MSTNSVVTWTQNVAVPTMGTQAVTSLVTPDNQIITNQCSKMAKSVPIVSKEDNMYNIIDTDLSRGFSQGYEG